MCWVADFGRFGLFWEPHRLRRALTAVNRFDIPLGCDRLSSGVMQPAVNASVARYSACCFRNRVSRGTASSQSALLSNTLVYCSFVCRRICTAFYEARSSSRSCRLRTYCSCTSKSILRADTAGGTMGAGLRYTWRTARCPGSLSVS